jgi:hypothetical protein
MQISRIRIRIPNTALDNQEWSAVILRNESQFFNLRNQMEQIKKRDRSMENEVVRFIYVCNFFPIQAYGLWLEHRIPIS